MGGRGGPLWQRLVFNLAPSAAQNLKRQPGKLTRTDAQGQQQSLPVDFLDYIEQQLLQQRCARSSLQFPFEFTGGFVGYLGYEIKAECGAPSSCDSPNPDAAMFFADRSALPLQAPMLTCLESKQGQAQSLHHSPYFLALLAVHANPRHWHPSTVRKGAVGQETLSSLSQCWEAYMFP